MTPAYAFCKSCGAEIFWAETRGGRKIPVNVTPDANGILWFADDGVIEYLSAHNPAPDGAVMYTSHFTDCPQSKDWQQGKTPQAQQGRLF